MGLIDRIGLLRAYLDANIFIYAVEGGTPYDFVLSQYFAHLSGGGEAVTSTLTLAEVLVKPFADGSTARQQAFRRAVQTHEGLVVVPITEAILIEAARLRAATRLKLPDAIHAATAVQAGCTVFLTNDGRIKSMPGLDILQLNDIA